MAQLYIKNKANILHRGYNSLFKLPGKDNTVSTDTCDLILIRTCFRRLLAECSNLTVHKNKDFTVYNKYGNNNDTVPSLLLPLQLLKNV